MTVQCYSEELKIQAVKQVTKHEHSMTSVSKKLGKKVLKTS